MQELRILHLEDDPFFADMVEALLKEQGPVFRLHRAETWEAFESALGGNAFDLILSDHSVPGGDGLKALRLCRRTCPSVPFIFLSGMLGEELAIDSLKNGAADYVLKTNMSRFIPTMMRTLNAYRETAALRVAEARIRRDRSNLAGLIDNTTDAIWSMDLAGNVIVFNSAASLLAMKMTGQPMVEGSGFLDKLPSGMRERWEGAVDRIRKRDRYREEHELMWNGARRALEMSFHPIITGEKVTGLAVFGRDVSDRKRVELAAREVDAQRLRLTGLYRKMRVPLHGLTRIASLLGKTSLDEGQRRFVGMMRSAVERLSELHRKTGIYEADLQALLGEPPSGDAPGTHRDFSSLGILIVDDNAVNQVVVAAFLEKLGCRGDAAYNGQEAVEACGRRAYDLILMDCQMPVMDGFAATEAIRSLESKTGARARIAAMTANVMMGAPERCLEAGMDGYLSKPLKLETLREELEKASNGARPA